MLAYSPLVKYVAGRMAASLPAHVGGGRPHLLRARGADLRRRALRPRPRDQVRDLRHHPHQGAIIDELRSLDWVPRSVRARAREIERVNARLEHASSGARPPTRRWPRRSTCRSTSSRTRSFRSRTRRSSRSTSCGRSRTPRATRCRCSTRSTTRTRPTPRACSRRARCASGWPTRSPTCSTREKLVVALYYYENLTLREIGEVLGVTESRVSQLHTKAILRLKSRLDDDALEEVG